MRGPLLLPMLLTLVVPTIRDPVDRVVPMVYELHLVLPMTMTCVPRSPVTLDAAGLQLRVLMPAEPTTSVIRMLSLLSRLVRAFYRPTEEMMETVLRVELVLPRDAL